MYSSGLANHVEEEADKIALDWLVPGKQLARIRQEVGYDDAEALASVFRIPVYEMKMRIGQIPRRHRWSEVSRKEPKVAHRYPYRITNAGQPKSGGS